MKINNVKMQDKIMYIEYQELLCYKHVRDSWGYLLLPHFLCKTCNTYRHSTTTSNEFGNCDVSININRSVYFHPLCCSLFTIHVQHHLLSVHSKVKLMPVLVKYLPTVR